MELMLEDSVKKCNQGGSNKKKKAVTKIQYNNGQDTMNLLLSAKKYAIK